MNESPRNLSDFEKEIVRILMVPEFPGRDTLKICMENVRATTIDDYGSLKLFPNECEKADVTSSVPVEGRAMDSDEVPIYVLLHASGGFPTELEIYKADGSEILQLEALLELEVYTMPPFRPHISS